MGCGGFTCTRSMLAMLNVLYIAVAFILIGVAAYAKAIAVITEVRVVGGIIACGVFLLLIAIVGLIGAIKHHQVLLFFYMIILFLVFLVQFAVACACLAVSDDQQQMLFDGGWHSASYELKKKTQHAFGCCGFNISTQDLVISETTEPHRSYGHPPCDWDSSKCRAENETNKIQCCSPVHASNVEANSTNHVATSCPYKPCWETIQPQLRQAVKVVGLLGLLFSFTELLAVYLTVRHRNTKDPKINPTTFI